MSESGAVRSALRSDWLESNRCAVFVHLAAAPESRRTRVPPAGAGLGSASGGAGRPNSVEPPSWVDRAGQMAVGETAARSAPANSASGGLVCALTGAGGWATARRAHTQTKSQTEPSQPGTAQTNSWPFHSQTDQRSPEKWTPRGPWSPTTHLRDIRRPVRILQFKGNPEPQLRPCPASIQVRPSNSFKIRIS